MGWDLEMSFRWVARHSEGVCPWVASLRATGGGASHHLGTSISIFHLNSKIDLCYPSIKSMFSLETGTPATVRR
jgi:hypothetical protein